jgi:glycosyltransferase involved in cell wall biosynthesis
VLAALARLQASAQPDLPAISLSLYTSWDEPCGVAQYSAHLIDALQAVDSAFTFSISAPQFTKGQRPHSGEQASSVDVSRNWQRGHSPSLANATGQVVWLQHHFAFYELDRALQRQGEQCRRQGKRVYITLHTTRPVIDFDTARRRTVATTLAAFDRVFVHTLDDLNYLKRIGLTDNVTQIPQGVDTWQDTPRPSSQAPIIGSFGFLLPHKGVNALIEAFAALRKKKALPEGAMLRLVTAVRDEPSSQEELARCQRTAQRLEVANHIEWMTDFLSDGFIDSFRHLNKAPDQYSWWSYRANARAKNLGWRIDYNMVSENLENRLSRVAILSEAKHSDHCPILLEIED